MISTKFLERLKLMTDEAAGANYDGVGRYRHYKGGEYEVFGIGEVEYNGKMMVVYTSFSQEHTDSRKVRGADFVLRPLNTEDGPDAWNAQAICPYCDHGIAGGRPCAFEHCSEGIITIGRFTKIK